MKLRNLLTPGLETPSSQDKGPDIAPKQPKRMPYKSHDQLEKDLVGFYGMLGMAIIPFNMTDGMIILESAEKLGKSVNEVAKHNKQFREFLVRIMQVSIYGALIASHVSVAIAIMQNHDMLPSIGSLSKSPEYGEGEQEKYMKDHKEEFEAWMNGNAEDSV